PSKAAPWFESAFKEITREDLGCHYQALVAAWTRVEDASKFVQGPTNLASRSRPAEVGTWINLKKRGTAPVVTDVAGYAAKWESWWSSLQPEWRVAGGDGRWTTTGGYGPDGKDWGKLFVWGVNGTLSLVASLYFWGCAVSDGAKPEDRARWEEAVQDTVWMLE
ncbi:hypothetical protein C8R43DRAFT_849903, partial [Mycena crocata]